jgi:hypothetical protein
MHQNAGQDESNHPMCTKSISLPTLQQTLFQAILLESPNSAEIAMSG